MAELAYEWKWFKEWGELEIFLVEWVLGGKCWSDKVVDTGQHVEEQQRGTIQWVAELCCGTVILTVELGSRKGYSVWVWEPGSCSRKAIWGGGRCCKSSLVLLLLEAGERKRKASGQAPSTWTWEQLLTQGSQALTSVRRDNWEEEFGGGLTDRAKNRDWKWQEPKRAESKDKM